MCNKDWRTRRETQLRVLDVEVNDLGQRVHLGCLEVPDEFCQAFFKFRIWIP
jgi:hypothetical protein